MSSNMSSLNDAEHIYQQDEINQKLSLGSVLFEYMKKYKKRTLQHIADTGEADTYEQVLTRSIRTAVKLNEKGITRNDIISTCTDNHKNSCVPWIASQFLAVKSANFDPNLSPIDTIYLLKLVQPKIIFVSIESVPLMEECLRKSEVTSELVVFGCSKIYSQFSEYLESSTEEESFSPVSIDDSKETAVIMFSSGTTGLPKGICLSHFSLMIHLHSDNFRLKQKAGDTVILGYTSFYWISAIWFLLKCAGRGGSLVVCSKFDPSHAWRIIEKYKVTNMFLGPYLAKEFLKYRPKDVDTSSLQVFLTGSSPVTKKILADLTAALPQTKVFNGYGQTEASCTIAFFEMDKQESADMQIKKPLSSGRVLPEFLWRVVDPITEKILGPNERGELRVKSDFLMNGYYKMDSSSAFDSEGYLKTGDIVYYDEEDCLYIVDRIKDMFKYKGWHIVPRILEEILMSHPAVKDAVVVGIPHETDGDHPMGIVVLHEGCNHVKSKDIEEFVAEKVPEIQRLRAGVKIVKEIVRTATLKIRRHVMRKMVLSGEI